MSRQIQLYKLVCGPRTAHIRELRTITEFANHGQALAFMRTFVAADPEAFAPEGFGRAALVVAR